ncbi:murein transglycosylase B, partial [Enterococcus faecium]
MLKRRYLALLPLCVLLVGRRMLYHNYPLLNLLNGIPMLKRRYLALLPLCVLL